MEEEKESKSSKRSRMVDDNEAANEVVAAKRSREEPKCPICLNKYRNLALIRACSHAFCFDCIKMWIFQKPNCPLCKTRIDLVKHTFTNVSTFEPNWSDQGVTVTAREIIEEKEVMRLAEHTWPLDTELELIERAINKVHSLIISCKPSLFLKWNDLKSRLRNFRYEAEKEKRINVIRDPLFRFVVYFMEADRHSLITIYTDVTLDDKYINGNRARLRSELMPFVAREIHAITELKAINIQEVMELLLNAFANPEQMKDKLFDYLKSLGIDHPRTFYRIVSEFAISDQSLYLYDLNSRYTAKVGLGPAFVDDSDVQVLPRESDEVQFVGVSRMNQPNPVVIELS